MRSELGKVELVSSKTNRDLEHDAHRDWTTSLVRSQRSLFTALVREPFAAYWFIRTWGHQLRGVTLVCHTDNTATEGMLRKMTGTPRALVRGAHLVLAGGLHDLVVADLVHELEALERLLDVDADVLLRQRARAERVVKHKQPLRGVHAHEGGHVLKVGQRGGQPHQPHHLLGRLNLTHRARHD
eukprot:4668183-Pyramimonas_sp.AAC.1